MTKLPPPKRASAPERLSRFVTGAIKPPPPKIVLVAVEGWGKTSTGAFMEDAGLIMSENETGYNTLFSRGTVPDIPRTIATTWEETNEAVDELASIKSVKNIILDEATGFEKQLFDKECKQNYKNNWSQFWHFHKGAQSALQEWNNFLVKLEKTGKGIMLLSHCKIENFKNDPDVEPYNRYSSALNKFEWAVTKQWSDAAFFGIYEFLRDSDTGKPLNHQPRIMYTTRTATHDAKNRYEMEDCITMPDVAREMWPTIKNAMGI